MLILTDDEVNNILLDTNTKFKVEKLYDWVSCKESFPHIKNSKIISKRKIVLQLNGKYYMGETFKIKTIVDISEDDSQTKESAKIGYTHEIDGELVFSEVKKQAVKIRETGKREIIYT